MFYMHDVGWGWEFLMAIGMVAFWALIIFGVVWLVRGGASSSSPASPPAAPESPLEILDRRLASGELTVEEYRERREAMDREQDRVPAPV